MDCSNRLPPLTMIHNDCFTQQGAQQETEMVEYASTSMDAKAVDSFMEREQLANLIATYSDAILNTIVGTLTHFIMTSKGLKERITIDVEKKIKENENAGIDIQSEDSSQTNPAIILKFLEGKDISQLNPKIILKLLEERVKYEQEMKNEYEEFLQSPSADEAEKDFVWLEADEELKPILTDLILTLRTTFAQFIAKDEIPDISLDEIMKAQIALEKIKLANAAHSYAKDLFWVGKQGCQLTYNVIIFSKDTLSLSVEAFKILCSTATLLGVGALVVQNPNFPILEFLIRFAFKKFL